MKTKVMKHSPKVHDLICTLFQASLKESHARSLYVLDVLNVNSINCRSTVTYIDVEQTGPLVHSIFICEMQGEDEPTQLIFTY